MATSRRDSNGFPDTTTEPDDWAGQYWARQQLGGDERGFLAMCTLLRVQRIVVDAVETILKESDLNITDYLLLMTLRLSETETQLVSSLARSLLVHATTATLATDRLESRRMLFRSPHPTDRRATRVTITSKGKATVERATRTLSDIGFGMTGSTEAISQLVSALTEIRAAAA